MKLRFKDVKPNPYRDLKSNPLLKDKIAELVASINTTGFWDNVLCRKAKNGDYQLAYGHHRVAAAIEAGLESADFIVKNLSDALMIQIMDNENREVYASSPASMIESVKAVVAALADGTIPPFSVDVKARKDTVRYAPSYVAGKEVPADASRYPYTASLVAEFLGRTYNRDRGGADTVIMAALNFLHLKELGAIDNSVLMKDKQPISARKLFDITSDLKQRTEAVQERRGKTQAELNELREKQLAAQAKAKADEKEAEEKHKALLKKEADARREENNRKADELAAKRKEADERAKAKEELNKKRMAELDEKIAQKKAWESQQRIQDAYAPIRRDVESLIGRLETMVSERNPMREEIKALGKQRKLRTEDRERLRKAAADVANWFGSWVVVQFSVPFTAQQELSEMRKRNA